MNQATSLGKKKQVIEQNEYKIPAKPKDKRPLQKAEQQIQRK